jgi:hypothetical protein
MEVELNSYWAHWVKNQNYLNDSNSILMNSAFGFVHSFLDDCWFGHKQKSSCQWLKERSKEGRSIYKYIYLYVCLSVYIERTITYNVQWELCRSLGPQTSNKCVFGSWEKKERWLIISCQHRFWTDHTFTGTRHIHVKRYVWNMVWYTCINRYSIYIFIRIVVQSNRFARIRNVHGRCLVDRNICIWYYVFSL